MFPVEILENIIQYHEYFIVIKANDKIRENIGIFFTLKQAQDMLIKEAIDNILDNISMYNPQNRFLQYTDYSGKTIYLDKWMFDIVNKFTIQVWNLNSTKPKYNLSFNLSDIIKTRIFTQDLYYENLEETILKEWNDKTQDIYTYFQIEPSVLDLTDENTMPYYFINLEDQYKWIKKYGFRAI